MELTRLISGALMPECCTNIFARERWLPDEASGICCAQISQHFASSTHPLGAWVWTESTWVSGSNSTHICLQPGEGRGAGERRRQSHGELWRALSAINEAQEMSQKPVLLATLGWIWSTSRNTQMGPGVTWELGRFVWNLRAEIGFHQTENILIYLIFRQSNAVWDW